MRPILLLFLIGITCQNIFASGEVESDENEDFEEYTFNNMRLERVELLWSNLARKLTEELTPKYDNLSDRLDYLEQQISELKGAITNKVNAEKLEKTSTDQPETKLEEVTKNVSS